MSDFNPPGSRGEIPEEVATILQELTNQMVAAGEKSQERFYEALLDHLLALSRQEGVAQLRAAFPFDVVVRQVKGTSIDIVFHGLNAFTSSEPLADIGIEDDDPRNQIYLSVKQSMIDPSIMASLRAVSKREYTACRKAGAARISESGTPMWWVPVMETTAIMAIIQTELVDVYHQIRDDEILSRYDEHKTAAEKAFMDSATAIYNDRIGRGENVDLTLAEFLKLAGEIFERKFPTQEAIQRTIYAEIVAHDSSLPEPFEDIFWEMEEAHREALRKIEEERIQVLKRYDQVAEVQLDLFQAERISAEAQAEWLVLEAKRQAEKLENERMARARLLEDSVEMRELREMVSDVSSQLVATFAELAVAIQGGQEISGQAKRRLRRTLTTLEGIPTPDPAMPDAVQALKEVLEAEYPQQSQVTKAEARVNGVIRTLQKAAKSTIDLSAVTTMIQNGDNNVVDLLVNARQEMTTATGDIDFLLKMAGISLGQADFDASQQEVLAWAGVEE